MAAANPAHAARLVRWMWRRNQTYVVSVDATADVDAFRAVLPAQDNVRLLHEWPVTWGGMTQVLSLLRGIESCLRTSSAWRWFINVSDSDIPLQSQERIVERLLHEGNHGCRDFVGRSTLRLRAPWYEGFKQPINLPFETALPGLRPDVRFCIHPQVRRWFTSEETSPIYNTMLRLALHTTDSPTDKTLYVRPLYAFEAQLRRQFYSAFEPTFGKVWVVLSRATCEWLLGWNRLPEVLATLAHTFCPDETVLHTALFSPAFPGSGWVKPDNLRWRMGASDFVKDELLPKLKATDSLFARKVRFDASDELFAWLDASLSPGIRT